MAFESTSPNMNLVIPGVGLTSGPTWSSDLNTSLNLVDAHDHSAGKGVQINPAGIDINADLDFNNNNALTLRSTNFTVQTLPLAGAADIGCLYVSGVDLYYNDELGNQIRITSGGSVNAGSGSITGLVSPASATYVSGSQTFVWQSGVNTAANMDMGSIILRKITAGSAGITIAPPSSLSASYTITLPAAPPAATSFMRMNNSGIVAADVVVDGTTITISSGIMSASVTPGPGSITSSMIQSDVNLAGNSVQENGKNVVVSNTNAATSLAVIRGQVSAAGALVTGEGFSVTRDNSPNTNTYHLTWTTAFASTPTLVGVAGPGPTSACDVFLLNTISTTGATYQMVNASSSPLQIANSFIVMGPRT